MLHAISREVTVRCAATPLAITSQGIEPPQCRGCEAKLTLHQPDEDSPEHLLATCGGCGGWFLIEITQDGTEAFLLDLPNIALFRSVVAKTAKARQKARSKKAGSPPAPHRSRPKV
jgi:hypothetical protein